jgi:hypothetical protein
MKTLRSLGACFTHRVMFHRTFGPEQVVPLEEQSWFTGKVPITVENLIKADDAGLSLEWLMLQVLTDDDHYEYENKAKAIHRRYLHSAQTHESYIRSLSRLRYKYLTTKWHPSRKY